MSAEPVAAASYVVVGVEATRALGRALGAVLRAGDLVVLTGPLGAGKTAFAQGVGAALGVSGVTSPTFVIARRHRDGSLPLVHVDAYRLGPAPDLAELDDLDLDAALDPTDPSAAVVLVEWGEGIVERLVPSWLEVRLAREAPGPGADVEDGRRVDLAGFGPRWSGVDLAGLRSRS